MSFPYKNPISPSQLSGQQSLERTKTYGTSYSTLSTGGYMEVYSLDQLYYTIPPSTYGPIEYSGNSIPITFSKGSGTTFSFDTLTLQPDNISSGRRKQGMLVYVKEVDQVYQYSIDNYETLWNAATGSTGTTIVSDFGTTIKANSPQNISFINSWTANTIDGVSGVTRANAVWKKYHGTNLALTGGSFNIFTGVLSLTNITGGTQFLSGFGSISGFTAAGAYGCFTDTTTQVVSAANTPTLWNINTTELSNGVYLSGGTKIRVTQYGIYNIAYSAQIERTSAAGGQADVTIWAKLNGNDIVRSSSTISLISNSAYQLPFVSYIVEMNQNDYLEFYFSSNSQYAQLTALSGLTSPTRPDAPSLIIVAQSVLGTTPAFTGNTSATCITDLYVENIYGCSPINVNDLLIGNSGITTNNLSATTISASIITLSSSASTISLNNPSQQQIRFFDGGVGAPTYNTYSPGTKIVLQDNISSIGVGSSIGVDTGILWYATDLPGNAHEWYAGERKITRLSPSLGFELFGLGGPTTTAMSISGTSTLGSKGGLGYMDFLKVVNNFSGATNSTKWFRTNSTGGLEILNNAYTGLIFSVSDNGITQVGGGNPATSTSQDATSNYLSFNNNNTQLYDDGNTHIHSRGANQAMWINTNGGQLNLLTQSPTATGRIGSGIAIATGTLNGYVTINTGRTVTTAAAYGYLTTAGAGTYPGGSQTISISLYANNRIWGQEIDAFSDERMKDIQGEITLEEGIKLVNNLTPIKYTWKEGDDKGIKAGYSAQQVSKVGFNHLISLIPKEGLEETIDEDGFLSPKDTQFSMNYDQVVPYHGVVIKHLLEEIENLKKEIESLKNK